jgi:uronate dehydrogenase
MRHCVLLTGADGNLGRVLRLGLRGVWPVLRLSHRRPFGDPAVGEEIVLANLEIYGQVDAAMGGVEAVIHMGGMADEASWEVIEKSNILGTYNVFEAARRHGVKRFVYASSNHIIGHYRRERILTGAEPPRPDSLYAVSKVFGEALGRMYADKYGLSVVSLRIGTCCESPLNRRTLSTWLSFRDLVQLVRICVEAPAVHYETVWGVSGNTRGWWDNRAAERLGYRPGDNAEDYVEQAIEAERRSREAGQPGAGVLPGPEPDAERLFQGGSFCAAGFAGDLDKID